MPVLSTLRNPLKSMPNRILKRAFDIIMSSICLCFYPLIYIPVAITIKLTSPGPVYFKQERTGYRGKSFQCLKFRSMHVNKDSDKAQATEHDPRKTKFGDFLRRSSIDELPQFINVWKGDMSIVGPRPHMLKHTDEYSRIISQYMVRHTVKPGITGWAQVNGFRGITDELWKMEKRVEHDVWYIEHWSFALDLKIIYRTIVNVFHGEKNAF
jgi:putative colanic acid biosynthesis UDP-glucose lipid carrier transferase